MAEIGEWEVVDAKIKRKIHQPGKQIMMMEVEFELGGVGAEHSHPHEQFTYVLAGTFDFHVDGKRVLVKEGETLYIPSNAVHGVTALEAGTLLDTFTPLREDLLK
ncbi:cupin domain-containing protein [Halalkalibacter okhensis]|uniref:Cupin n=1 Tax=Halalkalibacter okhensis TaxID=333138 RepID=A0A0B0IJJ1_9BACI|nr:cupin domain-containing protein [Halalkalibacter okhensis]KHF40229.1 cupin [Halalkalibacter okhensis]